MITENDWDEFFEAVEGTEIDIFKAQVALDNLNPSLKGKMLQGLLSDVSRGITCLIERADQEFKKWEESLENTLDEEQP